MPVSVNKRDMLMYSFKYSQYLIQHRNYTRHLLLMDKAVHGD